MGLHFIGAIACCECCLSFQISAHPAPSFIELREVESVAWPISTGPVPPDVKTTNLATCEVEVALKDVCQVREKSKFSGIYLFICVVLATPSSSAA